MAKSLIQKISDAGKSKIAPFVLAGALALGGAGLSGCSTGPQIRTEPVPENPYGNVELTELGKQYGVDMFTASGHMRPKPFSFESYHPGKGMRVFYPGETVYVITSNVSKITNTFEENLNNLTTGEKNKGKMKVFSFLGSLNWKGLISKFNTTKLYNSGLKKGFHTTDWEYTIKACRNGKDAPCDPLGSVYFTVTDKK